MADHPTFENRLERLDRLALNVLGRCWDRLVTFYHFPQRLTAPAAPCTETCSRKLNAPPSMMVMVLLLVLLPLLLMAELPRSLPGIGQGPSASTF